MIKEKTKNIVYDILKESKTEIKKMLNEEKINNFFNSDYYASNQINYFNKKYKNFIQNKIDISFPIINSNRTFSKNANKNHYISDYISTPNNISNKNINHKYSIGKEKKGILYKKRKMKEMILKNEDNEQMIIRDINRKIKSIYDNLKNKIIKIQ